MASVTQNSQVCAEAPGWYRVELILVTELLNGWQLFVDGTVIASCGRLEADAAKAWADVALGRQVAWVPGWPRQEDACWYWVAEPAPELSAAEAELVLVQLLEAQAAGDLTRMAAIRARLYPHQLAAVVAAADREFAEG
ncbi:hypothetical protein [Actinopolymorpha cephalotaxi]|uniref:Immunity protein 53 n=1 Tax=Actinopolymorpha cephalotaxi TaxID=504797 RepID=A0ABX2SC40_9ACTN|nr:hypothetical protein [Actinopolymorpha cephalotaxi]NYH86055.1 hypothetical protein [Actinopolymorpha cephalotaxi]